MSKRKEWKEVSFVAKAGWGMLAFLVVYVAAVVSLIVYEVQNRFHPGAIAPTVIVGAILFILLLVGFFIVNPNTARVLVLFGQYRGSVTKEGFYWTNPFTMKHRMSLKAHNIASERIKVNDLAGNPIEIGAVVVWQVRDTAQAAFNVEDYRQYVDIQIETALRTMAKAHPYDEASDYDVPSLRGDTDEVTQELQTELQQRLDRAGIEVLESRISHLAYAAEIASAMLQRQQAAAVVAAREKIVEGAVTMVEQALAELSSKGILELDDERRATMVGNLMVVLCGNAPATPVINTGSLYN